MSLDSFSKQPAEAFIISASFVNDLGTGELIVLGNSAITATDVEGNTASDIVLNQPTRTVDGAAMKIQVMAGEEVKSPYKITFRAVTNASPPNTFEKDIKMKIKEL